MNRKSCLFWLALAAGCAVTWFVGEATSQTATINTNFDSFQFPATTSTTASTIVIPRYANGVSAPAKFVRGKSPRLSVIKALGTVTGAVMESEGYGGTVGVFEEDAGSVMALQIRDLTIDGDANANEQGYLDIGQSEVADGIRLHTAQGLDVKDCRFFNIRGAGLRLRAGGGSLGAPSQKYDWDMPEVSYVSFNRCWTGITCGIIDLKMANICVSQFRDVGVDITDAGANFIDNVHTFGGPATGIGVRMGRTADAQVGPSYAKELETENVGYGLWLGAAGNNVNGVRAFECFVRNIYMEESADVSRAFLSVYAETPTYTDIVGLELANSVNGSSFEGRIDVAGTSDGIKFGTNCERNKIEARGELTGAGTFFRAAGAMHYNKIVLFVYGGSGSTILNLTNASGSLGNRIEIYVAGSPTNYVIYPGGGTVFNLHPSNEIFLNGVRQTGQVSYGDAVDRTIATGAIAVTASHHRVDTEAAAASDDLDSITGGTIGQSVVLVAKDNTHTVVLKDATGNLQLNGDFSLDNWIDTLTLVFDGTNWLEVCRSNNGS